MLPGKPWQPYLIAAQGGPVQLEADMPYNIAAEYWSPDGSAIIFSYPLFTTWALPKRWAPISAT